MFVQILKKFPTELNVWKISESIGKEKKKRKEDTYVCRVSSILHDRRPEKKRKKYPTT